MFSSGPLDPEEFAINQRQQIALTTFVSNICFKTFWYIIIGIV